MTIKQFKEVLEKLGLVAGDPIWITYRGGRVQTVVGVYQGVTDQYPYRVRYNSDGKVRGICYRNIVVMGRAALVREEKGQLQDVRSESQERHKDELAAFSIEISNRLLPYMDQASALEITGDILDLCRSYGMRRMFFKEDGEGDFDGTT